LRQYRHSTITLPSHRNIKASFLEHEEETKRTAELRQLLEDYAADLRALIEKLRRKLN
jgi:hypothetical protein